MKSTYQNYKSSFNASDLANNPSVQKDDDKFDVRDLYPRNPYGKHISKFLAKVAFEDRYNPAESHDTNEDDVCNG